MNNNLRKIPHFLWEFPEITEIRLEDNIITNIDITSDTNVSWIDLGGNKLKDFSFLSNMPYLMYLGLGNMGLTDIPSSVFQLPEITTLSLEKNKIAAIDNCIFSMKSLRCLDLSGNYLTQIKPSEFWYQIVELNINQNRFTEIPAFLFEIDFLSFETNPLSPELDYLLTRIAEQGFTLEEKRIIMLKFINIGRKYLETIEKKIKSDYPLEPLDFIHPCLIQNYQRLHDLCFSYPGTSASQMTQNLHAIKRKFF